MSGECFVYVIQAEGADLFKIGISGSPEARLANLQTASPMRLLLVDSFCFRSVMQAREIEAWFHCQFAGDRVIGEWFRLTKLEALRDLCIIIESFLLPCPPQSGQQSARPDLWECVGRPYHHEASAWA